MNYFISAVPFLLILVKIYCEKCATSNFKIVWQRTNLDVPNYANILDDGIKEAYIIKIAPNQSVPNICKDTLNKFPEISTLFFNNSGIETIQPGSFENSEEMINLKQNRLQKINHSIFNGLQISILNLGHNAIKEIDVDAFDNMEKLLFIDLSFNDIEDIPVGWFENTTNLFLIHLGNNRIKKLNANLFPHFKGSPKSRYDRLLSIYLENNDIEFIDEQAFSGIEELNKLVLYSNKITSLNGNIFSTVKRVNEVNVRDNRIQCILHNFDFLRKIGKIILDDNSFNCTCLRSLENWHEEQNLSVSDFGNIDCMESDLPSTNT